MWTRIDTLVAALPLVWLAACEPPGEIQVREDASGVEVTSLVTSDTTFGMSPIDTSGILPGDELTFNGSLVVNSVSFDAGLGVQTFSFAGSLSATITVRYPGPAGRSASMDSILAQSV